MVDRHIIVGSRSGVCVVPGGDRRKHSLPSRSATAVLHHHSPIIVSHPQPIGSILDFNSGAHVLPETLEAHVCRGGWVEMSRELEAGSTKQVQPRLRSHSEPHWGLSCS